LLCDLVPVTESHTKSHLRFGAKKDRVILVKHQIACTKSHLRFTANRT
jgi:hypothetical protein